MKILYAASEVLPFSSSGGLADVMGSLPASLKRLYPDSDIRVISPLYSSIKYEYREKMKKECEFRVRLSWREQYCAIFSLEMNGVIYYFVDNEYYFKRGSLYGHYDDGERFAYFSMAVNQAMGALDFYPDILHANDWQTALTVIYLKTKFSIYDHYRDVKAVFSIHNILFQGQFDYAILGDVFDLPPGVRQIVDHSGCINLMKGAVVCADIVVTVSPRYAEEIKTSEYGHGLESIMRMYSCKLYGILNGIDYDYYNPHTDKVLYKNYTYRSVYRKKINKTGLQKELGLPVDPEIPMVSVISRLTDQKGIDLIADKSDALLCDNVQLVVLGCGDARYENFFRGLQYRHDDKMRALIMYDKDLSKKIYAASDVFLMPSKTEPCGLAQMIASRYGAVPVVRETGGLYDSIHPYRYVDGKHIGNGFTFFSYNADDMLYVTREALATYRAKQEFAELVARVMKYDFSWKVSAEKYAGLYNTLKPKGN